MTHKGLARILAAAVTVGFVATALSACVLGPTQDQNLARWLDNRAGVAGTSNSARYPEFQYEGTVDVHLDPKASEKTLKELVTDTVKFMTDNKVDSVEVTFGIHDIAFTLFDGLTGTLAGLDNWEHIHTIKGLLQALVGSTNVQAATLRTNQIDVMHQLESKLAKAAPDIQLDGYQQKADLPAAREAKGLTDITPVTYSRAGDCVPDDDVRSIIEAILGDTVDYGKFDLCDGIDAQYVAGYGIAARAIQLRTALDAVGQSAYPVEIGALTDGSVKNFDGGTPNHRIEVTPGDAAALGALAPLDAATTPINYALATETEDSATDPDDIPTGSRTLDIVAASGATPATGLFALVAAAPAASAAALADISLDDGKVAAEGTAAQLTGFIASASALQAKNAEIVHLKVGAATGELVMKTTGSLDSIPNVQTIAKDLHDSGLWHGRAFGIFYDNQEADVNDGVAQPLDPSHLNNDDEALQGFLDAWNAVAK